jgi:N-formylglutamate deformylase
MKDNFEISENENSPIVCNVPHSGLSIPDEFLQDFKLNKSELDYEVMYMADNFTDKLYKELLGVSSYIKSNLSRVVVDIERFLDEDDEPMSKVGMSAFYTKTSNGLELRNISDINKVKLKNVYNEYHFNLRKLVEKSLNIFPKVVIVDCHSFASKVRAYESDKYENRPDICIGSDTYHTPDILVKIIKNNFESLGYKVEINSPFAGSIVPLEYYGLDKRVESVMIEVNRKLYMNEITFQKLETFNLTSKIISRAIIKSLNEYIK